MVLILVYVMKICMLLQVLGVSVPKTKNLTKYEETKLELAVKAAAQTICEHEEQIIGEMFEKVRLRELLHIN